MKVGITALKDRRRDNQQPLEGDLTDFMTHAGKRIECHAQHVSVNSLSIQAVQEVQPPTYLVLRLRGHEVALVVADCKAVPGKPGHYNIQLKTALPEYDLVEIFTMSGWLEQADSLATVKRVS